MTETNESHKQPVWSVSLVQSYLETARSVLEVNMRSPVGALDHLSSPPHPAIPNLTMSIASISFIFSYMAVESYVNYLLYETWTMARSRDEGTAGFSVLHSRAPLLADAMRSAGKLTDLKTHQGMREITDRIKSLETLHGWPHIYTTQCSLWQEFIHLSQDVRHYLIHPIPDPLEVQRILEKAENTVMIRRAPQIAEELLGLLYDAQKQQHPSWLHGNELFTFTELHFPARH